MKKFFIIVISIAFTIVAGNAAAADSNTLTVAASVTGTCRFSSGTSTLNFGALDQSSAADASATGNTQFWCTRNATYTVGANNGLYFDTTRRMRHASENTEFIPYNLTFTPTAGTGSGKTSPITLNLSGTITNANYVNAVAGNYADTVTLSITP
jgi:spore coat protein U-like protein